ncbi:MAG TPA: hypothetical protein PKW35_22745 [Nannocystaceae bacterium]|nr:hypothetical protein [Nannocystaceae bacterium]
MKVPTSMQRRAPMLRTSSCSSWPCSGAICMFAVGIDAVTARSRARIGGSRRLCSSM